MKFHFACFLLIFLYSCSSINRKSDYKTVGSISTPMGEMLFVLSDLTPNHKKSFIQLAEQHYWDTLTFNRVIKDFVIQGGCPDTPEGFADSPYLIKPEFHDSLRHVYGAVGIGRDDNAEKLSAGCQFYIVHNKKGIPRLDGKYMIIGQVFKGLEVLDVIGNAPTNKQDEPLVPIPVKVRTFKMSLKDIAKHSLVK
jgi:peptidyl-prolyl cis-trans isomerase B (cyclophilin B)